MLDLLIRITSEKNGNLGAVAAAAAAAMEKPHIDIMKKEDSVCLNVLRQNVCVFYEDSKIELDIHGNAMCKRDGERG